MDTPLWIQIWELRLTYIVVFAFYLILIGLVMVFRDTLSKEKKFLDMLKYFMLGVSFVYVGLVLKAQPTTTNIIILVNALRELQFPISLYMMEPFIFLSFIFIFITLFLWGRGVFCGWLCPYGAMLELINKIYHKLFPKGRVELPERANNTLIYLKYILFLLILGASFYSFMLSEYMTELEPFRTFVLRLNREWYFVMYFMVLTIGSVIIYRAFCRYLCPLGAALALPSFLRRLPLKKLKRYDFCSTCKICTRSCAFRAIRSNGIIDNRECMDCLDCQINYWDQDVCPVLIKQKKERDKARG
jgi:NosR/NirI family nitrous oxide reductase transcriptional regulator